MATVGQYSTGFRLFQVEDDGLNEIIDGFYLNSDTNPNYIVPGSGNASVGSLIPGNLIYADASSSNLAQQNAKRPSNTLTSIVLTNPSTAATVADSGAGGTFSAAVYTFVYVGKNAAGQITAQSATATVTPTASHGVNVTIPSTGTSAYTSADVYCSAAGGGANEPLVFLANILAANFNAAQTYTAPPNNTAAAVPANVNTTSNSISGLAATKLGLVFGAPYFDYMPTDNSIRNGQPVSMIAGRFTAVMDSYSFSTPPTALGQYIYPDSSGVAANQGLWTTAGVGDSNGSGVTVNNMNFGWVIGFEPWTSFGGPGVQQSASYSSATSSASVLVGGAVLVRVRFDLPYIPKV